MADHELGNYDLITYKARQSSTIIVMSVMLANSCAVNETHESLLQRNGTEKVLLTSVIRQHELNIMAS